jgi:hypothetical protein
MAALAFKNTFGEECREIFGVTSAPRFLASLRMKVVTQRRRIVHVAIIAATGLLFNGAASCRGQGLPENCAGTVTGREMKQRGWIGFRDGRVTEIDLRDGVLAMEKDGRKFSIYFNGGTQVCHSDKPATIRDIKVGDRIGGYTKLVNGKSVAIELGYGGADYPYGIPVPGRRGYVQSPYAPTKPPLYAGHFPYGGVIKCPYTGKLFKNPTP